MNNQNGNQDVHKQLKTMINYFYVRPDWLVSLHITLQKLNSDVYAFLSFILRYSFYVKNPFYIINL